MLENTVTLSCFADVMESRDCIRNSIMTQSRTTTKHRIMLTDDERQTFKQLLQTGRTAGWKLKRAAAMLKCDESSQGPAWTDAQIAAAFDLTVRSLEKWRKQAVEHGLLSLLKRKTPDRSMHRKLDGTGEAKLIQLACSTPPEG
jgi:hypothetical protein